MILYILIALAVVIVGLVVFINSRPATFRVSRSATIPAPASALFEQVNDFHKWQEWSPWAKMDPYAKNTFDGPGAGVGAKFAWDGKKTGAGAMTLIESQPVELIRIKLDFLKPMQATNTVEFTFVPTDGGTLVTWSMWGKNNLMGKMFGLIVDCDKMCGTQFEQGLENLRDVVGSEVGAPLFSAAVME
jgi:uncharacterized protein YndB with AHSA1/START domain